MPNNSNHRRGGHDAPRRIEACLRQNQAAHTKERRKTVTIQANCTRPGNAAILAASAGGRQDGGVPRRIVTKNLCVRYVYRLFKNLTTYLSSGFSVAAEKPTFFVDEWIDC